MSRILSFSAINLKRKYRGIYLDVTVIGRNCNQSFLRCLTTIFSVLPSICQSFSVSLSFHKNKPVKTKKVWGSAQPALPCTFLLKLQLSQHPLQFFLFDSFAMKLNDSQCLYLGMSWALSYPVSRMILFFVRGTCS